jgi:hypothetical protein
MKEVVLLGKEKDVNYFYECITRLKEYQDNIQLSHWLSHRFYSGLCTEYEKEKLLETINRLVEETKFKSEYVIIKEPFFNDNITRFREMDNGYYRCKNISKRKFERYNVTSTKLPRPPLIIP